jgi:hypothetical protein
LTVSESPWSRGTICAAGSAWSQLWPLPSGNERIFHLAGSIVPVRGLSIRALVARPSVSDGIIESPDDVVNRAVSFGRALR